MNNESIFPVQGVKPNGEVLTDEEMLDGILTSLAEREIARSGKMLGVLPGGELSEWAKQLLEDTKAALLAEKNLDIDNKAIARLTRLGKSADDVSINYEKSTPQFKDYDVDTITLASLYERLEEAKKR